MKHVAQEIASKMMGGKDKVPPEVREDLDRMNQLASQAGGYISSRQVVAATIILHARMRETLAGAGRGDR